MNSLLMQRVQLFIDIIDQDGTQQGNDDLIDILLRIDHTLPVGECLRETYIGMFGFVTMDLSITVLCVESFKGPDCTVCVPGFTGTDCQTNIDECIGVNCSRSNVCVDCINSFICNCGAGYVDQSVR